MTPEPLRFEVRGMPVAQGSVRAFVRGNRAVVAAVTAPLSAWRHAIATEARDAIGDAPPIAGPVSIWLTFRFPRPQSHFLPANRNRPVAEIRLDAPAYVTSKPDADKVARAALDAMTGVVYGDDSQVAHLSVAKRYANADEGPGVLIQIRHLATTA